MNTRNIALGVRKNEYAKKLVGIVEVVTGEKVAKLTLTEDGKEFANGKTSITVNLKDLPKRPALAPNQKTPKQYRVRMNEDGDAVESLGPVRGMFKARAVDLGKRPDKDADPAPYVKTWNQGKDNENSHLEFFVVYEIIEGVFKGVQLPAYQLHYKFDENPEEEGFARFAGNPDNPKATRLHQLVEWGQVHGHIWSEPITWNADDEAENEVVEAFAKSKGNGEFANILPELLERVLDADVEVNVVIDKGYIQGVQPVEDYEFVDPDDDSDAVDELLDGEDEVEPVKIKSKAPAKNGKVKPAPAKRKASEEEDDL